VSALPDPGRALVVGLATSGRAAALLLCDLGWDVVAVDRAIALHAFTLGRKASKRLPLADALIAATAANREAVLVHRDPHFDTLPAEVLRQEKL
jgi:predicted nucleic acid-binding protein